MQTEDFEFLNELEEHFWWFVGMREIQAAVLDPLLAEAPTARIVDVGCGTGGNITWLGRYRPTTVVGLDVVTTALEFCRGRGHTALTLGSATQLPVADESADVVTLFDIIQQLPGDGASAAFTEVHRVLVPGGVGFVRTAAYEWMRSGHDVALATPHRFTVGGLERLARDAGLAVIRCTYANTALLPVAALRRLVLKRIGAADEGSDVKPLPPRLHWLNRVLAMVLRGEAWLLRHPRVTLPFGLSAIVVVRKPESV